MMRIIFRRGLLALLLVAALAACSESPKPPAFRTTDISGAEFGKGFKLFDTSGRPTTLADFKGKVVVLFFGFTHVRTFAQGRWRSSRSSSSSSVPTATECRWCS